MIYFTEDASKKMTAERSDIERENVVGVFIYNQRNLKNNTKKKNVEMIVMGLVVIMMCYLRSISSRGLKTEHHSIPIYLLIV